MKPLYSSQDFSNARSRDPLPCECLQCGKSFLVKKHLIQSRLNGNRTVIFDFCSRQCARAIQKVSISLRCAQCQSEVIRSPKEYAKSKSGNVFCSRSCAVTWNNTHKTKGTRVSKLEIWMSKQLPLLYPNTEFHFNSKTAINSELDIYIPSLKLAFELNGIYHYEPIHGTNKLSRTKSNDIRKSQACLERGIELHTIDVSSFGHFKQNGAQHFLDIIVSVMSRLGESNS